MIEYDFTFDVNLIKTFIGKTFNKYKNAEFVFSNSVSGIVGIEIDGKVFKITNDYEAVDFLTIDDEATVFRNSGSEWNKVEPMICNKIVETIVNEKIMKILLINDHTILNINDISEYDLKDTKGIIFCFEEYEIAFCKRDCWLSLEIDIYKGYNLISKVGDGKGIIEEFKEKDDEGTVIVERKIDEIK